MKKITENRDNFLDVFKAIAIVSIVVGHAPVHIMLVKFVYTYHIMAFFFAIWFALKPEKLQSMSDVYGYIGRSVYKNLKYFFFYACLFALLHNTFLKMGILAGDYYSKFDVVKISILGFAFYGAETFMGAFWFIPVMLVSVIIAVSLLHITARLKWNKLVNLLLFVGITLFALLLYQKNTHLTYFIQVSFLALPVIMAGYFTKKYWHTLSRFVTWYGGLIAADIVLIVLKETGQMIELSKNEILTIPMFYPVTFLGIYFCLAFAKVLDKGSGRRIIGYIGRNTYHIMALHFVSFKLLDFLYAKIGKIQDSALSAFPTSHYSWGGVYVLIGVLIPLCLTYLAGTFRHVLQESPTIAGVRGILTKK